MDDQGRPARSAADMFCAAVCTRLDGPDGVETQRVGRKPLGPRDVRVAVRAAGVNYPDLLLTKGAYQLKLEPPFTPGMEAAGEVIEIGVEATGLEIGAKVIAGVRSGAFAEEIVVPSGPQLQPLPSGFSFEEGASFYVAARTAYHALVERGGLAQGETALILGATGGVGLAAVQIARALGATVIAVGSSDEKLAVAARLGADHVVNYAAQDLRGRVKDIAPEGVDVAYDPIGGPLALETTRLMAWHGRYLIVGFASGEIPTFPANHALIKGYSIIGLRAGEAARRDPSSVEGCQRALRAWAEEGRLTPHIGGLFPLERAADALRVLENRGVVGRLAIRMDGGGDAV